MRVHAAIERASVRRTVGPRNRGTQWCCARTHDATCTAVLLGDDRGFASVGRVVVTIGKIRVASNAALAVHTDCALVRAARTDRAARAAVLRIADERNAGSTARRARPVDAGIGQRALNRRVPGAAMCKAASKNVQSASRAGALRMTQDSRTKRVRLRNSPSLGQARVARNGSDVTGTYSNCSNSWRTASRKRSIMSRALTSGDRV